MQDTRLNRSCPFGDTIYLIISIGALLVSYIFINIKILLSSKITLFYSENLKDFQISETKESPALLSQGRANFLDAEKRTSFPPQQREFVPDYSGAGDGIRTRDLLVGNETFYH